MKPISKVLFVFSLFLPSISSAQINAYYFAGLGSDYRIFQSLDIDSTLCVKYIDYPIPSEDETMQSYAKKLCTQIDTTKPYVLIGTSIGGMLAVELTDILSPERTFIIASAKTRQELPLQYRFQRVIPIHKIVTDAMIRNATRFLQPIVEPDSRDSLELYRDMLDQKDTNFMKRAVEMILLWDRSDYHKSIIHIHGTKDHTIPFRNVNASYLIEDGSHMMTLTRSYEIGKIIRQEIFH